MAKFVCERDIIKFCRATILLWLLTGCAATIPIKPVFEETPIASQIQARVGSACRIPIHAADYAESFSGGGIFKVNFDQASLSRFEQVFRSLFSDVILLPPWPSWRETRPDLDGVIELDAANLKLSLGDDMGRTPERVEVKYRVCLYSSAGKTVNCWESQAEQIHQRQPFERFNLFPYLEKLVEATSREAIAHFMLAFEGDPAVKAWAEQRAHPQGTQQ